MCQAQWKGQGKHQRLKQILTAWQLGFYRVDTRVADGLHMSWAESQGLAVSWGGGALGNGMWVLATGLWRGKE